MGARVVRLVFLVVVLAYPVYYILVQDFEGWLRAVLLLAVGSAASPVLLGVWRGG